MTECNAIIKANNEIDKLKRENKKLNELCVQYGFDMGKLEEKNEQLKEETILLKRELDDASKLLDELTIPELLELVKSLNEENQVLKKENERLKKKETS